ncbi:rod shape-determining protein MreC [Litorivicinus sp.]|nr:rod shape-determining protein MreC [Litorivicinus sp.]MDC1208072.1 rod shape-determining protein MreC [Litorivicinus sp.]
MRPLFSRTSVAIVRFVIAVTFSVATMVVDVRFEALSFVRQALKTSLWPIEKLASAPQEFSRSFAQWLNFRVSLVGRLESLSLDNERLKTEQLKLQTLRAENAELRRLLSVKERFSEQLLQAEINRLSNDPFIHRATINRGFLASVKKGQPVLSADGLVGQVVAVYPHASEVLLVTDSTHQLPVQVTRTRDRAIAIGVGLLNRLELRNLPDTVDMVSGDLLETSGLGGRFQSGIPVARVIDVIRSPGQPFARVMAVPIAQLSRLSLVMVDVSTEGSR